MKNDRTYNRLKESIYRGRLRPGHRIVERDLARRMGVSRIPLRESLVRLETEGLVRSVPYSATFVEDLSPVDVLEIYSMRLLLEPLATRLAATRGEPALVEKLKRLCEQMTHDTATGNPARLDRTDYRFHHAIVIGSGHTRLIRAYESAHIRIIGPRTNFADVLRESSDSTAREHLKIVQCIERRDPERAEKFAREAVQVGLHCVERAIGMTLEQVQS
jgi:DNA-binding GntR family transcriptional regulator